MAIDPLLLVTAAQAAPAHGLPDAGVDDGIRFLLTQGVLGFVVVLLLAVVWVLWGENKRLYAQITEIHKERIGEAETRVHDAKETTTEVLKTIASVNGALAILIELVKALPQTRRGGE